ncbi:MAG: hypothetical protein K2X93_08910 [Candidatus Obscuribacterales bacterium]|nr:hypothetical protein [Candidatus Obscuribacterales bacterium]
MPLKVEESPQLTETIRDYPPPDMGGAIDGEVAVKTTVLVTPPFVLRMYCPEGMRLTSQHSVPYTFVVLPPKKAK